jgi:hypothetical protein
METSILTPTQRYAAAALFALALHQSQVHQTKPLNALVPLEEEPIGERVSDGKSASVSEDPLLWVHEKSGLLWHVFRFFFFFFFGMKRDYAFFAQLNPDLPNLAIFVLETGPGMQVHF